MAETGILRPDARVELLDGRTIDPEFRSSAAKGRKEHQEAEVELTGTETFSTRPRFLPEAWLCVLCALSRQIHFGVRVDKSPIGPLHGGLVKRLSRHFNLEAKGRWGVSTQNPLHPGDQAKPQAFPDASVDVTELLAR